MKFRPEGTTVTAYQRGRRTCKEDSKAVLAQETDGFHDHEQVETIYFIVPLSHPAPGHLASITQCITPGHHTVQAGTYKIYRNYINSIFSVTNKGKPVIYFYWNHWDA